MVDERKHVCSIQSINYTNRRIMQRKHRKENGNMSKRNRGRCSPSWNLMQTNFYKMLGPNLRNPDTPVLGLLTYCTTVASNFFYLYKIIHSVWPQKVPVAFLVRGPHLQVVSYCVALSQSFTVKVLRRFTLQCYSLSIASSEKSVPTSVTVCSYCCIVPSRTTQTAILNTKSVQIKITISVQCWGVILVIIYHCTSACHTYQDA